MPTKSKPKIITTWPQATRFVLKRTDPTGIYSGPIERGVNYFVLMLEQLGATTHYSCEGHPNNFYVVFEASQNVANKIHNCGYFRVELEGQNLWSLRMRDVCSHEERITILKYAANAWTKKFGPICYTPEKTNATLK